MPMKIQFDAQQQYQLDAVSAVGDIFDGQPLEEPDFTVIQLRQGIGLFEGHVQTEIGVGNRLAITADELKRNARRVQQRNEIEIADPRAVDEEFCLLHSVHQQSAANASVFWKLGRTFQTQKALSQVRERVIAKQRVREPNACAVENLRLVHPSFISWNRVELYNEVWNQPLVKLSRKYGISDVRLGKVCRRLSVPHPGRGYWAKKAVGQTVERVPLPEFKDTPVVKRLIRESKPGKQR